MSIDLILGVVALATVTLAASEIIAGYRRNRLRKQKEEQAKRTIDHSRSR